MQSMEQPSSGSESRESADVFGRRLDALASVLGPEAPPLPDTVSEQWLQQQLSALVRNHRIDTYNEQSRYNEFIYRRAALERRNDAHVLRDPEQRNELIVAEQAVAYHEYFRTAANHVMETMRRYEALRAQVSVLPPALQQQERQAMEYIDALRAALAERTLFSHVLLIDQHLADGFGDAAHLRSMREQYVAQLSSGSRDVLDASNEQKLIRANQLNQRIIEILGGQHGLQGIEEGYLPKRLYLDFLQNRYKQLLDDQKQIAADPRLIHTIAERDRLALKHQMAETRGETFTEEDVARYDHLQERIHNANRQFDTLDSQRKHIIDEILWLTDTLGVYNIEQTELAAIQRQFGGRYSFEGVGGINPLTTPPDIRDAIMRNMESRKKHHLSQMSAFLHTVDEEVLDTSLTGRAEDLWNKEGRKVLRSVTHRIAAMFTFAVPESFGMQDAARSLLTAPLDEVLGWPVGKETWEELTDEEKESVIQKSKSVLDHINNFDRSKISAMQETVSLLQGMEAASAFVGQEIRFDDAGEPVLPQERVTASNVATLQKEHGGAAVYMMLLRQLEGEWGTDEPPSGVLGEYAQFLHGVNDVVGDHLKVGRALHILRSRYEALSNYLLAAAVAAGALGAVGMYALYKLPSALRAAARSAAPRAVPSSPRTPLSRTSPPRSAAPRAPAQTPGAPSRVGNILGKAGIALVAIETARQIDLARSLRSLPEMEAVSSALELMEGHPQIDKTAYRYTQEVAALRQREALLAVRHATQELERALQQPDSLTKEQQRERQRLLAYARRIVQAAHAKERDLHAFFPITDYIHSTDRDPQGIVRVQYRRLDEARSRGMEYEKQKRTWKSGLLLREQRSFDERMEEMHWESIDGIEEEYEKFIGNAGAFFADVYRR